MTDDIINLDEVRECREAAKDCRTLTGIDPERWAAVHVSLAKMMRESGLPDSALVWATLHALHHVLQDNGNSSDHAFRTIVRLLRTMKWVAA